MTTSLDDWLAQGFLIAVDRDSAKRLFGARDSASLRQFLADQVHPAEPSGAVACLGQWPQLQQAFQQEGLVSQPLQPALRQCISGGRMLCDEPGLRVSVIRPDLVPHIAAALASLATADLRNQLGAEVSDAAADAMGTVLEQIRNFYARAAHDQAAVVFAAHR